MITISPGHWHIGTGAVGFIDEVREARKVVQRINELVTKCGITVHVIEDHSSSTQQQNLRYLVNAHNNTSRELDVSVHLNATKGTQTAGIGTEVLYKAAQIQKFASELSASISNAGRLKNRGAKQRQDLAFLNQTTKPALLIEVCFVNSKEDVSLYEQYFDKICMAIADKLVSYFPEQPLFSSPSLQARIEKLWGDAAAVEHILVAGISRGSFQPIWLEKWRRGELALIEFMALCTLQLQLEEGSYVKTL